MQYLYFNNEPLTSLGPLLYKGAPLSQRELLLASKNDTLIKLVKDNMEEYLRHFIDCNWGACYNTLYRSVIKPHLDDIEVVKKVLKSDVIILKDSPHSEYIVHVEPLAIRESPNPEECMKLYPQLYYHLKDVECEEVKSYIENLWSRMEPIKIR